MPIRQSPKVRWPAPILSGHNDSENVTLTANDGNGNTASCSFTVTLLDVTPPTIVCPANVTLAADANCSGKVGAYSWRHLLSDNCAANRQSPKVRRQLRSSVATTTPKNRNAYWRTMVTVTPHLARSPSPCST
ncbi:MAG: hypothetical protein IPL65_03675 [Lewinellaceae bacterium]|nr:hypothetical protein [Lewinellaceae bacterium]